MAQPTYKDLLDYLGLQNWQFILIALFLVVLYPLVVNLWKMKIVGKIKVKKLRMKGFHCVYISYYGSYSDITTIYNQCVEDFKMVFKFSNYFAVFYEDPTGKSIDTLSKALIGVCVKDI